MAQSTCTSPDCEAPVLASQRCTSHYYRWRKSLHTSRLPGSPFIFVGRIYRKKGVCHLPTCRHPAPRYCRGLCQKCFERQWRSERVEIRREQKKRWAAENPERKALVSRESWLGRYNLTVKSWNDLYDAQNGMCAVCSVPLERRGRNTHVDHDHSSGFVRGLLCRRCNRALGLLKDEERVLQGAIRYLRRSRERAA